MTARNRAMSLSSSSSVLNLTENSNLGSIIWPKGFLRLLRNSRVMKICPYDMRVPSLFIRGAIMMIKISITPYFSKVTCKRQERTDVIRQINTFVLNSQKSTAKPTQRFYERRRVEKIYELLLTWSLRSRSTNPGILLANSVTSLTASADRDWQLLKKRSSTASKTLQSESGNTPVGPEIRWREKTLKVSSVSGSEHWPLFPKDFFKKWI